jgi:hypothetical protein
MSNAAANPLAVNFRYYSILSDDWTTTAVQDIESLDPTFASQFSSLQQYLTTPLGELFNSLWAALQPAQVQNAQTQFATLAAQQGFHINNVAVTLPLSGDLDVEAKPAKPLPKLPPGYDPTSAAIIATSDMGILQFTLTLPNCDVSFHVDAGDYDLAWDVTFDIGVSIWSDVPLLPFTLAFNIAAEPANAHLNADNQVAQLVESFDNFANWITSGGVPSISNSIQGAVDNAAEPLDVPQLDALASTLNSNGAACVAAGFRECGFSIVDNDTLTLTITHPQDPRPAVLNAGDPQANDQLSDQPALSASETQVQPGATITVLGTNFPVQTMTQLTVEWSNTSSGTPAGAQIKVDAAAPLNLPVPNPFGGWYSYTASGLSPSTEHTFAARCSDTATWSKWSHNLSLTTANTKTLGLALQSEDTVTMAFVELSDTSTQWSRQIQIPEDTAYGTYDLIALWWLPPGSPGAVLAKTQIKVVAELVPVLQLIDPTTQVLAPPPLLGGTAFTVRGEGFPDGAITVKMNGVTVGSTNASSGEFVMTLTVPGNASSNSEFIVVSANGGGVSATLDFTTVGSPK